MPGLEYTVHYFMLSNQFILCLSPSRASLYVLEDDFSRPVDFVIWPYRLSVCLLTADRTSSCHLIFWLTIYDTA